MSRDVLLSLTRRTVAHATAGTLPLADDVARVPSVHYHGAERWRLEIERVFRRVPLVLAASAELREPHAYKAVEVVGVPVLVVRGGDGAVRAFVDVCSHRGAMLVEPGTSGTARRFTCPYHAWSYDSDGALVGVLDRQSFGELDTACLGLVPLPCAERAGLVFVGVGGADTVDLDAHLCGYGEMLEHLGLADCHHAGSQVVHGPNWKVAYDGYLDFYHLPVLHKDTFGATSCNKAIYDAWGPHQRVSAPDQRMAALSAVDEGRWTDEQLTDGIWTVFPHVSVASFRVRAPEGSTARGGRMFLVSVLYPGTDPDTSTTVQHFLAAFEPTEELRPAIDGLMGFLMHVVRDEDYATGNRIQRALKTGARPEVLFGRNEGGGQRFHGWVERLVAAESIDDTRRCFSEAVTELAP